LGVGDWAEGGVKPAKGEKWNISLKKEEFQKHKQDGTTQGTSQKTKTLKKRVKKNSQLEQKKGWEMTMYNVPVPLLCFKHRQAHGRVS